MIKDIYKKYNQERTETKKDINNREKIELIATLEDLNLNKLVKSKKTGKVGVLKVEQTSFMAN
jgi:alpha-N-acetylglucosamine transferase